MAVKFRLEDASAPSGSGLNPLVGDTAIIDDQAGYYSQHGCRPDNCQAGGGCRSKRNIEVSYKS